MGSGARDAGQAAELRLPASPRYVAQARRFAVEASAGLGADDGAQDVVRSLVSELVTNVVLHAGTDALVRVRLAAGVVRVEVVDASPAAPLQRRVNGASTTGRGLRLVQALSRDSGVEPDDALAPGGKQVWFTVATTTGEAERAAMTAAAVALFDAEPLADLVADLEGSA